MLLAANQKLIDIIRVIGLLRVNLDHNQDLRIHSINIEIHNLYINYQQCRKVLSTIDQI